MTKAQTRAVQMIRLHAKMQNDHAVAAGLSAEIRAAMRAGDRAELMQVARELGCIDHPEFIVGGAP